MADTQFVMDGQTDGWTDRQRDGVILICLLKFLQGLKKFQKVKFPCSLVAKGTVMAFHIFSNSRMLNFPYLLWGTV